MWEEVARAAAADASAPGALSRLQSLDVVYCQSWQYDDPSGRLAERLGTNPSRLRYSGIGGSVPQLLVAEAAEAILDGDLDLALVVGAEALATRRRMKKAGERPEWSFKHADRPAFPFDIPFIAGETNNGIFEAYLTFALFDNARRAHLGRSISDHRARIGPLLSHMTELAAADPVDAWFPVRRGPAEIVEPTPDNRMVAFPYTKLMTSIMDVDMAAGLLLASDATANELGVPAGRRVYLRGWGYARDPDYVAERRHLWRSAAMAAASRAALAGAGIGADDVAHLDLYSCFASSLSFALDALGVDHDPFVAGTRSPTVTGGLPYHGGPGSNYMTHSMAAMAERLRGDPDAYGLVSGVGMHMTKHIYGLWSATPGTIGRPDLAALSEEVAASQPRAPLVDAAEGPATVATYSVLHGRDGTPDWGALVCDLPGGARCYARVADPDTLALAEREQLVGRAVTLSGGPEGSTLAVLDGEGRGDAASDPARA